ncbi:unnamed protein product [Phytophthora fragariaefolia]|uniref:Unnamed protein product n=1 Tax=Phytophthora fragariaefolia TaxID=1490495 RepID=A0A9W7DC82_9STRA|nr:unnamed protein product [Phytophthora fragariaefolia]
MQVRTYEPATLDETVQFAEDKCGDRRRSRPRRRGWGSSTGRNWAWDDTEGKAVSRLANTAQKDPLSLAALRALILLAGIGREDATGGKAAASKTKVSRTLEVKGEDERQASLNNQQQEQSGRAAVWQNPVGGYTGAYGSGVRDSSYGLVGGGRGSGLGGGFGGRGVSGGQSFGRERGGGRGVLEHYGPQIRARSRSGRRRHLADTAERKGTGGTSAHGA